MLTQTPLFRSSTTTRTFALLLRVMLGSLGVEYSTICVHSDFLASDLPGWSHCRCSTSDLRDKVALIISRIWPRAKPRNPNHLHHGHGDIPMSVRAMKGGAMNFLNEAFRDQDSSTPFSSGLYSKFVRAGSMRNALAILQGALWLSYFDFLGRRDQIQVRAGTLSKQIAGDIRIRWNRLLKVHRRAV